MIIPKELIENENNTSLPSIEPETVVVDLSDNDTQINILDSCYILRDIVALLHEPQTTDTIQDWVDTLNGKFSEIYRLTPYDTIEQLCNIGHPIAAIVLILSKFSQTIADNIDFNGVDYYKVIKELDSALLPYNFLLQTH